MFTLRYFLRQGRTGWLVGTESDLVDFKGFFSHRAVAKADQKQTNKYFTRLKFSPGTKFKAPPTDLQMKKQHNSKNNTNNLFKYNNSDEK